ncbi:DUF1542 domain-containing protein [Fructobacillus parabroussonetiae]|uniref:DUF1542 domain-containing protein n=1 Tax=Fructobacillus parabroussonetiae TaxID=2713174 RepID=UPI003242FBC6
MDADHKPNKSVDDQKTDQKKNLKDEAQAIINKINADTTLTTDKKNEEIGQVQKDLTTADDNIDKAADAQAISQAYQLGKDKIDADYVPGTPATDHKNAQKSNLNAEAQRVINAINADNTLTNDEKQAEIRQVNSDLTQANQNIDNAQTADAIDAAFNTSKTTIDADHKPGTPATDHKNAQKGNLKDEAQKIIDAIKADTTLTDQQKQDQIKQVNDDLAKYDQLID